MPRNAFRFLSIKPPGALACLGALFFFASASTACAGPERVEIRALLENAVEYHGREVTVSGEAIGDLMVRGSHGWLNIAADGAALGIYATAELFEGINFLGRHNVTGDLVEARGVFLYASAEKTGGSHLVAEKIRVLEPGRETPEKVDLERAALAVFLCLIALASFVFRVRSRNLPAPVSRPEKRRPFS